jgi:uncharacterized membrane protein YccC
MSYLQSYKTFNKLVESESFEPLIGWGIRMGLSCTLPIIWGLATNRVTEAIWICLAAEAVTWVELKGSFAWRVRTLAAGGILALLSSLLGTVTGFNVWLSIVSMFVIGFTSTVLKDIGDRASGLTICSYLLFIICNAYPALHLHDIETRMELIALGVAWPAALGIVISLFRPAEEPFRRQLALIWRSIASLVTTISSSAADPHSDAVYTKEKELRTALNNSYTFYARMANQADKKNNTQYQLIQLRKTAGMAAVNIIAIGEEMAHISVNELDNTLRIKAATLFSALQEAISRISILVITLRPEERLLAATQISRLSKLAALIRAYPMPDNEKEVNAINRILQLTERTTRLLDNALQKIDAIGQDKKVYRSYSFSKTIFLLSPRYFLNGLRVFVNINSFTTKYALRSAIAASVAMFIFKWFHIDHGYWLPFSVMIVIQPYFSATLKRGMDRVVGTLLGGLAGSLLLHSPAGLHLKEIFLFLTFILMVYYFRKQYAIAAFVITLNLVLLFNLESAYNNMLLVSRAACTIGGSLLAIISGFALLPTWDEKLLPTYLLQAIESNRSYFRATFSGNARAQGWTRSKRNAESRNSNVFDSFHRYRDEPGKDKTATYYDIITCNVRITRNLNNIHLEQDEKQAEQNTPMPAGQQAKVNECNEWFDRVAVLMHRLSARGKAHVATSDEPLLIPFALNQQQMIALEKIIIELKAMHEDITKLIAEL